MPELVVCSKCSAKWDPTMLERKRITFCQLCKEPGLRVPNERGEASEEIWKGKAE